MMPQPNPDQIPLLNGGHFEGQIEVAPGKKVVPLPDGVEWSRVAIVDWIPQGDNTYRPVARIHERWIRVSKENVRQLGLGLSVTTIYRLIRGGFIRGRQVSPGQWQVDLLSYELHARAVEDDPEFWDDPERRQRYRESI